jgi:hypothetical protein
MARTVLRCRKELMSKDRRIAPGKFYGMNGTSPKKPRIVTLSKLSEWGTPALQAM